jgi:hypothetical protein
MEFDWQLFVTLFTETNQDIVENVSMSSAMAGIVGTLPLQATVTSV